MDVLSSFLRSLKSKPDVSRGHILAHFLEDRIWCCPSCGYLQQEHAAEAWPGLPAGLKFEPSDDELIRHLRAKLRVDNCVPHPLLDDFIPTLEAGQGICYTHPEKLPGISRDGSKRHFFHRHAKAYKSGSKKRRRIEDDYDCRWHKTGKTRPVLVDGKHLGFKKILVLYTNFGKNRKVHKTNWVMHQYHLGNDQKEKDGELVVSKIFHKTHNCTALPDSASKLGVAETSKFNTLGTENSATKQEIAETCNSSSVGMTNSENSSKLYEFAGSDATSKRTITTSANSWITRKDETDDDSVFRGIEQNSTFVDKGCLLRSEGKEVAEWSQFHFWTESPSESFHNMNSSSISLDSFPI